MFWLKWEESGVTVKLEVGRSDSRAEFTAEYCYHCIEYCLEKNNPKKGVVQPINNLVKSDTDSQNSLSLVS